jgi:late competence protein required for DNA uptake (superfamily II DNA/RNA helicase)
MNDCVNDWFKDYNENRNLICVRCGNKKVSYYNESNSYRYLYCACGSLMGREILEV